MDECFTSALIGNDFVGSDNITNLGGDMGLYNSDGWQGSNLGVSKPYECNSPRAIRLSSSPELKDVVGFRLSGGLAAGTNFNVSFKVIKTDGNFSFGVYSRAWGQFYDDGVIGASAITTQNGNFGNWTEITLNFTVPVASGGHNWLFLRAEIGEGIIANICQNDLSLPSVDLGADQELCDGETTTFNAFTPGGWYAWSNGSLEPSITVGNENSYSVTVNNACGDVTDNVLLTIHEEPELNIGADTILCEGTSFVLEAPGWNASYQWQDGSTNPTFTVDSAGVYNVNVQDNCFNTTDEVTVSYLGPPEVDLGSDSTVCGGTVNYYVANGGPTSSYIWNTGIESPGISITETGDYSVEITNMCGTASDNVYVEFSLGPGDFLSDTMEFCEGIPMVIDLTHIEGFFEWSDGSTDDFYNVPNPGWHYVRIVDDDSCFVANDTIVVTRVHCDCPVFLPNSFTPNGDGYNEEYNISFDCPPYDYKLTIFDRWGQVVFWTNNSNNSWDGRNSNGKLLPSSVFHYVLEYKFEFQGFPVYKRGTVTLIRD